MEKPVVHLFRGLIACLVLLLLLGRTRGEESNSNFMDEMKHDDKLCKTSSFLYNSSLAKRCGSVDYPKEEVKMSLENINIFTCLMVYDSSYKLCNYSSYWKNPFENTAAFNSHIETAVSNAQKDDKKAVCNSLKGIQPMYEKTKNLVAPFITYLNDDGRCSTFCFFGDQLDPLCAMLAWIHKIDEAIQKTIVNTVTNTHVITENRKPSETSKQEKSNMEADSVKGHDPKPESELTTKIKAVSDPSYDRPSHSEEEKQNEQVNQPQTSHNNAPTGLDKAKEKYPAVDSVLPQNENVDTAAVIAATNLENEAENNDNVNEGPKNNNETPNIPNNLASNVNKGSIPSSIEDTKTSTISQNTQDHVEMAHDYGRLDNNERVEPDDADQPPDTNDQSQYIPEPSEQRDILPRYHSIRPEEESHFFTYFTILSLFGIAGYIGYHNKQKILAIVVEGRRSRNSRGRRRPSTASYRKLDCTLEEAVTSQCNANVTHVIY